VAAQASNAAMPAILKFIFIMSPPVESGSAHGNGCARIF
jgi:hypothetical protein